MKTNILSLTILLNDPKLRNTNHVESPRSHLGVQNFISHLMICFHLNCGFPDFILVPSSKCMAPVEILHSPFLFALGQILLASASSTIGCQICGRQAFFTRIPCSPNGHCASAQRWTCLFRSAAMHGRGGLSAAVCR